MIIRTKKYKLPPKTYMLLGFKNILREQWWVFLVAFSLLLPTFYFKTIWFFLASTVGLVLYGLFWLIQFYGTMHVEASNVLFERLGYEINGQQILIQINAKQSVPIQWEQIQYASHEHNKGYFFLVLSKTQFLYFPHKIFNSQHEIKSFESTLKRKKLIQ